MRVRVMIPIFLLVLLLFATAVAAQEVINSTVSGTLISASAIVPALSSVTVFTTPGTGAFILTQFVSNATSLRGSTFGPILIATYFPGVALPQGEALICRNEVTFPGACMVVGVVQSAQPPPAATSKGAQLAGSDRADTRTDRREDAAIRVDTDKEGRASIATRYVKKR